MKIRTNRKNRRNRVVFRGAAVLSLILLLWTAAPFAAALVLCFVIYTAASVIRTHRAAGRIKVRLTSDGSCERGEDAFFRIEMKNSGALPAASVRASLHFVNRLNGEEWDETKVMRVDRKAAGTIEVKADHSGCIGAELKSAAVTDPLAVFGGLVNLRNTSVSATLYVMPRSFDVSVSEASEDRYDMESLIYSQERSGTDPGEVFDLREYRPGDSMKGIHWKLSAKSDDLIVREPGYPVDNRLLILLDKCQTLDADAADRSEDWLRSISGRLLTADIAHSVGWIHPDTGQPEIFDVTGPESLTDAVMRSLQVPYRGGTSTVCQWLAAIPEYPWNRYIYLSDHAGDVERLSEYGKVIVERPGGNRIQV